MKITNNFNLPDAIVRLAQKPSYSKGVAHLSVTEMMNSPQISIMRRKYDDQVEVDVSTLVYSMFGTAFHNMLEKHPGPNDIVEERLYAEFDGWHISGAIDVQTTTEAGIEITDWKTVGVWAVQNPKPEWEQQLNVYAWLVEHLKAVPVTKLSIVAILKDFSQRESETRANYPKAGVVTIDIPLWSMERREEYIRERIHAHSEARFAEETGAVLPPCTSEEMWEKETVYALKKDKAVRAKSLHASLEEAEAALEEAGKGFFIETRPGERTRCKSYCQVSQFCTQYQSYLEEKQNEI
jgi:hypothetical protein